MNAVADFLGFDGRFGWQGPDGRGAQSAARLGDAFGDIFGGGSNSAALTVRAPTIGPLPTDLWRAAGNSEQVRALQAAAAERGYSQWGVDDLVKTETGYSLTATQAAFDENGKLFHPTSAQTVFDYVLDDPSKELASIWATLPDTQQIVRLITDGNGIYEYGSVGDARFDGLGLTIHDLGSVEAIEVLGARRGAPATSWSWRDQMRMNREVEAATFRQAPAAGWGALQGIGIGAYNYGRNLVTGTVGAANWALGYSGFGLINDLVYGGRTPAGAPSYMRSSAQTTAAAQAVGEFFRDPLGNTQRALDASNAALQAQGDAFRARMDAGDIEGAFRIGFAATTENTLNLVSLVVAPELAAAKAATLVRAERLLSVGAGASKRAELVNNLRTVDRLGACFVAGTLVQTREGLKPIELVRIGDFVRSQPEMGGDRAYRRVNDVFSFEDKAVLEIVCNDTLGRSELFVATHNHPFWVKDIGWTAAVFLEVDQVLELVDGREAWVTEICDTGALARVYNFEVDGFHTYYVGELGVWVHNDNCHLIDLPIHPDPTRAFVRADELLKFENIRRLHPTNELQWVGGEGLGRGGVRDLTNDELLSWGGPSGDDPITIARQYGAGDNRAYPASLIQIQAGHHRMEEVVLRIQNGALPADTLIEARRAEWLWD
jgi:hypothetical protein